MHKGRLLTNCVLSSACFLYCWNRREELTEEVAEVDEEDADVVVLEAAEVNPPLPHVLKTFVTFALILLLDPIPPPPPPEPAAPPAPIEAPLSCCNKQPVKSFKPHTHPNPGTTPKRAIHRTKVTHFYNNLDDFRYFDFKINSVT